MSFLLRTHMLVKIRFPGTRSITSRHVSRILRDGDALYHVYVFVLDLIEAVSADAATG